MFSYIMEIENLIKSDKIAYNIKDYDIPFIIRVGRFGSGSGSVLPRFFGTGTDLTPSR